MLYINQRLYPQLRYDHDTKNGPRPLERASIASSGCGICSTCMVVEHITTEAFSLEECIQMSYDSGANQNIGTDIHVLGPAVAERFGLTFEKTRDPEKLIACLQRGGEAVVNVGGDTDGEIGLFTRSGHYIVAISYADGEFCLMDPGGDESKFDMEGRAGKVRVNGHFIYCPLDTLLKESIDKREHPFYLFNRK